jgi:hypothetical protein
MGENKEYVRITYNPTERQSEYGLSNSYLFEHRYTVLLGNMVTHFIMVSATERIAIIINKDEL